MELNTMATALDGLWYGTDVAYQQLQQTMEQINARINAGWSDDDEDEEDKPYLLEVDEESGIAFVNINGPMTNTSAWYDRYFGRATYPAIREAVVAAAIDENVKHIILNISSGGGAVNGVSDVGNLIRMVNDRIKPVTAFTDGTMASAAYWLGCSAGNVFCTSVSTVGSIGVIATHMEYSKQLKDEGITATVLRAGKFKALVNSIEPLTEEAKAQFQSQLEAAYKVFVQHVAESLNLSYDHVDANMAQGREFFGEQALAAGLVDGITSFDALTSLIKAKILDNSGSFSNNPTQTVLRNQ